MIYAYGICLPSAAEPPPACRGLGGAGLSVVHRDGLAAIYSRHRTLRPRPTPDQVLAHERVVEAIMARGSVLPLRFGAQLETEEHLVVVLEERRDELLRALEHVRGRVELGLRALPVELVGEALFGERNRPAAPSDPRERSGRDYLLARVAEQRRRDRLARELHAPLAELAVASVVLPRPAPPAAFVATYLVEQERVSEFRARATALGARREDVRAVVTGPWPPYSFTTGAEDDQDLAPERQDDRRTRA